MAVVQGQSYLEHRVIECPLQKPGSAKWVSLAGPPRLHAYTRDWDEAFSVTDAV